MFDKLKKAYRAQRNKRYLERWAASSNSGERDFYVKRQFEMNLSYCDLYWNVKRVSDHKRVETIYMRADEMHVADVVRSVETNELPRAIERLKASRD